MRALLRWLVSRLPVRVIFDETGTRPYLSRFYLFGAPERGSFDANGDPKPEARLPRGLGLYVHRFHRSDEDRELHNHPWQWALSLVLAGGYVEERRIEGGAIRTRVVGPGSLNYITADTFHRVDLIDEDAWTLFLVGPRVGSWGFWDRVSGAFIPWREFLERKRRARFWVEPLALPAATIEPEPSTKRSSGVPLIGVGGRTI